MGGEINLTDEIIGLKDLINITNAYDKTKKWVYLSMLWYDPINRKEFSRIITGYLNKIIPKSLEVDAILILEGLPDTYALTPIVYEFSILRSLKLAIWRDTLPYSLSESWIIPHKIDRDLNCIIFQDATSKGSTLSKTADDLKLINWRPLKFINLIQNDFGGNTIFFEKNFDEFQISMGQSKIEKNSLILLSGI